MWPDVVNAIFEAVGGAAIASHCVRLFKDKLVRGVFWPATLFFTTWGIWNLYYYAHLAQWWSWTAGIMIATANLAWCGMLWYYIRAEKQQKFAQRLKYNDSAGSLS